MSTISVQGSSITIEKKNEDDYVSLTDMAKFKNPESTGLVISHWLSTRFAIEFLGIWEQINNPNFNVTEFSNIRFNAGSNGYVLSAKQWIERTNAIGIISSVGRYGGTYAHKDIAFEFGSWLSPEFKYYLIKEYQRLKDDEQKQLGWSAKRELAKINYRIHTDAIKQNLIPQELTPAQKSFVYADEADLLNVAMFGMTAKEWREQKPELKGNIRDYASINQLICLSNMENLNAVFINDKLSQSERLEKLNRIAIQQMKVLENIEERKLLSEDNK
ncbi:KilA-N domain-containing protein [Treponema sp.]|uniref:KilA-N domain-containing protein n=1 Tax=Treponema sp. TaxID=166 RepID=UPI003FD82BDE